MCAYYLPNPALREVPVVIGSTALLFIDTQNYNCHRQGAIYRQYSAEEAQVRLGPSSLRREASFTQLLSSCCATIRVPAFLKVAGCDAGRLGLMESTHSAS